MLWSCQASTPNHGFGPTHGFWLLLAVHTEVGTPHTCSDHTFSPRLFLSLLTGGLQAIYTGMYIMQNVDNNILILQLLFLLLLKLLFNQLYYSFIYSALLSEYMSVKATTLQGFTFKCEWCCRLLDRLNNFGLTVPYKIKGAHKSGNRPHWTGVYAWMSCLVCRSEMVAVSD